MSYSRRHSLALIASAPALMLTVAKAKAAATPPVYSENGVAIDGTDAVAYFRQGAPIAGSSSITLDWNGATWRFSSLENKAAFAENPTAYAPQYGGYCAYAVSKNYTAPTVPEAWKIVDGKLYLNFSLRVRRIWERDIPGRIAAANRNWPGVLG